MHGGPAQRMAPQTRQKEGPARAHLEEEVEEEAHGGVDGEGAQRGEARVGADDEGGKVGERRDGDADARVREREAHALLHGVRGVGEIERGLEDKHAVDADANHDKGEDGHQRREEEAHVRAEAVRRRDGEADVDQACRRRAARSQRGCGAEGAWEWGGGRIGGAPPMVRRTREPTQPSRQLEMARTV